jgi:hypothetical protein
VGLWRSPEHHDGFAARDRQLDQPGEEVTTMDNEEQTDNSEAREAVQRSLDWQDNGGDAR